MSKNRDRAVRIKHNAVTMQRMLEIRSYLRVLGLRGPIESSDVVEEAVRLAHELLRQRVRDKGLDPDALYIARSFKATVPRDPSNADDRRSEDRKPIGVKRALQGGPRRLAFRRIRREADARKIQGALEDQSWRELPEA